MLNLYLAELSHQKARWVSRINLKVNVNDSVSVIWLNSTNLGIFIILEKMYKMKYNLKIYFFLFSSVPVSHQSWSLSKYSEHNGYLGEDWAKS